MGIGKFMVPNLVTLGQGHQNNEAGHIYSAPHDKIGNRSYNATKLGRCIPVVKFSTSFTFGGILSETFSTILFVKFRMRFRDWYFKIKSGICYISAKNGSIATKQKANISIER